MTALRVYPVCSTNHRLVTWKSGVLRDTPQGTVLVQFGVCRDCGHHVEGQRSVGPLNVRKTRGTKQSADGAVMICIVPGGNLLP